MTNIIGYNVDLLSLVPAIFAFLLSIYNWIMMKKPANIYPDEIISYGLIASEYHDGMQLCIPLILHNGGASRGLVSNIKIGFKQANQIKYLHILGKAKLLDINVNKAYQFDWDSFESEGYVIVQPTYPIVVDEFASQDVVLIAQTAFKDNIIPINTECSCVISVKFGRNKTNSIEFPFFLSKEISESDNTLNWLEPM